MSTAQNSLQPTPSGRIHPHPLAITDEAPPLALRSTRNRPRTAVRRGAAQRAVLRSCSARPGPRRGFRHRGAVMGGQAPPDAATRAKSGRPAGGRRSRGCPGAGHAGRRPVRVLCPPCGRPSNRSRGRPVSTRPVSTRPVPSRCPDGRASGVRGSAAALSAPWDGSVRPAVPLDAMGSTCRRGPRAAWSPARIRV
jgi:hypothetical protein